MTTHHLLKWGGLGIVFFILIISLYLYSALKPPAQISFNENVFRCDTDADCTLFSPDCADCEVIAINAEHVAEARAQKQVTCTKNPPKYMCDMIFTGEVKCIESRCTTVVSEQ